MINKQVIALSKAEYRGVEIMETAQGCTFIVGQKQYDFASLNEAIACIDAIRLIDSLISATKVFIQ